jgi:hypothetical protein
MFYAIAYLCVLWYKVDMNAERASMPELTPDEERVFDHLVDVSNMTPEMAWDEIEERRRLTSKMATGTLDVIKASEVVSEPKPRTQPVKINRRLVRIKEGAKESDFDPEMTPAHLLKRSSDGERPIKSVADRNRAHKKAMKAVEQNGKSPESAVKPEPRPTTDTGALMLDIFDTYDQ